jgi:hypothetical protein
MATISKIRIANMALSNVGARSSIESFTEGTAESNEAELWYDYSRLQTLEVYDWSFARKRLTLATHSDDPPAQWAYRYQYPSDCVSFRKIANPAGNNQPAIPFEIETDDNNETKSILTNLDDAVGVFTFDLETVALFSPFFVEMFSFALASHIAMALTGKLKVREAMVATFGSLQRAAPATNANERVGEAPKDADWVEGR